MKTHHHHGKPTAYGFSCGYSEIDQKTGLCIWHQHGCYHVAGWLHRDSIKTGVHVSRGFRTVTAARDYARNPFTPIQAKVLA